MDAIAFDDFFESSARMIALDKSWFIDNFNFSSDS